MNEQNGSLFNDVVYHKRNDPYMCRHRNMWGSLNDDEDEDDNRRALMRISYILKEKHCYLMLSHYIWHVTASHRFKFEYADVSPSQSFNNKCAHTLIF